MKEPQKVCELLVRLLADQKKKQIKEITISKCEGRVNDEKVREAV